MIANEWDRDALWEERITCVVCTVEKLHDRLALPEPVTLAGEMVQDVLLLDKPTSPENPFIAPIAMLEIAIAPTFTEVVVVLTLML